MKCIELSPRYTLCGLKRLVPNGFALPLFRSENFDSNSLYIYQTHISGDLRSPIMEFEDVFFDREEVVESDQVLQIGDWPLSVFCINDKTLVGTARSIFDELRYLHRELEHAAPLSFLDLCFYSDDKLAYDAYENAYKFLLNIYSESQALAVLGESSLRKYVTISLCRALQDGGSFLQLPKAVAAFQLQARHKKSFQIVFPDEAFLEIDVPAWRVFNRTLASYLSLAGVEFSVKKEGASHLRGLRGDGLIGVPMHGGGKQRTRRLGLAREVAIDLGTTETRLFSSDGLILSEPSLVALQSDGSQGTKVLAVGDEALVMEGRTPLGIKVVRPIRDGAIVDIDITSQMLKYFIRKARKAPSLFRPLDVVLCVPSGSTGLERRTLANAARGAGASKVSIVLQSVAAAIGAGLAVTEPIAFLMLTIGGGVSEAAIISFQGIAFVTTIKSGGDRVTEEILSYFKRSHNLSVGWNTAENLKRQFGVASPAYADKTRRLLVRGIDSVNSLPKEISISESDLAEVIEYSISTIVEAVRTTLENAPPMLSADIIENGLIVAGGGALLRSLKDYLEDEIGLPVTVAQDPSSAVARGINVSMAEPKYSGVLMAQ